MRHLLLKKVVKWCRELYLKINEKNIKNLFYTFIWNFCPQLIQEGYVYALVAPLYKITMGKDTYLYLRDDKELAEFQEKNKGKKYQVNRFKGYEKVWPLATFPFINGVA